MVLDKNKICEIRREENEDLVVLIFQNMARNMEEKNMFDSFLYLGSVLQRFFFFKNLLKKIVFFFGGEKKRIKT